MRCIDELFGRDAFDEDGTAFPATVRRSIDRVPFEDRTCLAVENQMRTPAFLWMRNDPEFDHYSTLRLSNPTSGQAENGINLGSSLKRGEGSVIFLGALPFCFRHLNQRVPDKYEDNPKAEQYSVPGAFPE
jgi:hypothetical protein